MRRTLKLPDGRRLHTDEHDGSVREFVGDNIEERFWTECLFVRAGLAAFRTKGLFTELDDVESVLEDHGVTGW